MYPDDLYSRVYDLARCMLYKNRLSPYLLQIGGGTFSFLFFGIHYWYW